MLIDSLIPPSGSSFPILTFGSSSGPFSTVTRLTQGSTHFTLNFDPADVTLTTPG
jgi:hypothetical protein